MALKELPFLSGGKGTLVGTYFAEQVSAATYDLLSVAHPEQRRPATHPGVPGSSFGRGAAPSSPGSAAGRRRHFANEQVGVKCTVLPALQDSYTGLLQKSDGPSAGLVEGQMEVTDTRRELREAKRVAGAERIHRSAARMCRGEAHHLGRPCDPDRQPPSDEDVMRSLTKPLASFSVLSGLGSGKAKALPPAAGLGSPPSSRGRGRRHDTYREAFTAGLAGTDLATLPARQRVPVALAKVPPAALLRPQARGRLSESMERLEVLPEDPVEAYFKMEQAALQERKARGGAAEAPLPVPEMVETPAPSKASTGPTPESLQPRKSNLRDVVRHALYKEDGILAQTRGSLPHEPVLLTSIADAALAAAAAAALAHPPPRPEIAAPADPSPQPGEPPAVPPIPNGEAAAGVSVQATPASETTPLTMSYASVAAPGPPGPAAPRRGLAAGAEGLGDVLEAVAPKKISATRREACHLLRFFTFGSDRRRGADKDRACVEPCGSKEQVKMLFTLWDKLDMDGSGVVDMQEFRGFVERAIGEAQQGCRRVSLGSSARKDDHVLGPFLATAAPEEIARLVTKLCDRMAAVLASKKGFTIEDMMRIIWPCCGLEQLKQMRAWCDEMSHSPGRWQVKTPEVLPRDQLEALQAVFRFFDKDRSGTITVEELIHSGLLDRDMAQRYITNADADGDGALALCEFCELMCPAGFRAKAETERGTTAEGQRVVLDRRLGGWRYEGEREEGNPN